jgi:uncharacterized protein (TIGR02001 family)
MKAFKLALVAAVGALALGGAAQAQDADAGPVKLSFNVGASTDYVFRGISQTDENPQVFAGVDAALGSIGYAGAWVSNVDFNNGTSAEFDLYGGIKPVAGAVTFDLGVIYYGYTNQPDGPHEDYWEGKLAASTALGKGSVGAALYYSPEFFGETGEATYIELNGSAPLGESKWSVSGALGRQYVVGDLDYTTWNLGFGYALTDHVAVDFRYWDTSEHGFGDIYGARGVFAIKAVF